MSALSRSNTLDASTVQANIVAAVSAGGGFSAVGGGGLAAVLDAVSGQVYEPQGVFVVGGGAPAKSFAEDRGVGWSADLRTLLDDVDQTATHIWLLHHDARPRPDALYALAIETVRVDASVAGSKLLNAEHTDVLESVGGATDVFCVPHTGLEDGEVDQEQYDVVRDVAFTPGASVLVRRDLLKGLGGPDAQLAPFEAGIDFSQRARVAGGRVVVVPSSEVLHEPTCGSEAPNWRKRSGRIRSALKIYSLLTLSWLIPVGAIIDLLDGVVRLAIGPRSSILDVFRSWSWNLVRLPSTIAERRVVRRSRQVNDAELFRYQARGSSVLRKLGDDLTDAVRGSATSEGASAVSDLVARGRQVWQQPGVLIGLLGLAMVFVAARGIIFDRLPATGYALHLPESSLDTLRTYAGGWNPAELGNPRPLHPSVGISGLAQLLLFGRASLAEMVLTVGGSLAAFVGTSRLLRLLGVGSGGRFIAGVVAFSGPAVLAMTGAGLWPGVPALGALPFAIAAFLLPWPSSFWGRVGRVAADALPIAVVAAFAPLAALIPAVAVLFWFVFGFERRWQSLVRVVVATALALPVLAPWIVFVDPAFLIETGRSFFWEPPLWASVAFAVSLVFSLLFGSRRNAAVTGWGGLLVGIGFLVARTSEIGSGVEPAIAGLAAATIGLAVVAGGATDSIHHLRAVGAWRRLAAIPGVLGGIALAGSFFFVLGDGALGFGSDEFGEPFEFTTARQAAHGPDRVLLIGQSEDLPGDARLAGDFTYRLFQAPEPTQLESRLHPSLEGDRALRDLLISMVGGDSLRPGEQLAPFGIRWIVFVGESPLEAAFTSKLDVKPLPLTEFGAVYENLVTSAVAEEIGEKVWMRTGLGFEGRASPGRVRIAVNADPGWQPEPATLEWAATVSATDGVVRFVPDAEKAAYAWIAGGLLVLLSLLIAVGRRMMR